ncbi:MAG: polyphosphate kinase 2 family protein [Candidatus Omnitrophica bacterium]|nr:polyphosphate kinase 2 family protein [Candidatus Omnitrophota bacterium]
MNKIFDQITPIVFKKYRVAPHAKLKLCKQDPEDIIVPGLKKKDEQDMIGELQDKLAELQYLLYAEHKHKILIVLQGMDASGKDGTIQHVFKGVNPQGVRVATFKVPSKEELDHDYLWRIHQKVPVKGEIVIFNRSHYEDVIITRVHDLVPTDLLQKRYEHINNFERMLVEEGTTILKIFLNISKEEQTQRLEERLDDKNKNWKLSSADLLERKLWPKYMDAYEDAIKATSTTWAPWFIIPSNKKWQRNLSISILIIETLKRLNMHYPKPEKNFKNIRIN